ncbi:MAG: GGDEF domain-containing protein [Chloroflexi bacterium]|nr:GGDEF domain-containing protein [Chloroflexota bacterium]
MRNKLAVTLLMIGIWYAMFGPASRIEEAEPPKGIVPGQLQVYEDPTTSLTLDQIMDQASQFSDVSAKTPSYFFSSSAYWFRIPVQNLNDQPADLFLNIKYPTLDFVTLHIIDSDGQRREFATGDRLLRQERPVELATTLALPFSIGSGERVELFVRVQANAGAIIFPYEILEPASLQANMLDQWLMHGIMLGLFVAIFMYDLALFIFLKKAIYFYYLAYLLSAYFIIIALDGFGLVAIYPVTTWLANEGLVVFSGLAYLSILLFTRQVLNTRENKSMDWILKSMMAASGLLAASPLFLPVQLTYQMDLAMLFIIPLSVLPNVMMAWRRRLEGALYNLLANVFLLIGMGAFGLVILGILPFQPITLEIIPNGLLAGALLHFFGMANKVLSLQNEKLEAEKDFRQQLEIRQEELEKQVAQRTIELDTARKNAELLAVTDSLTEIYNRRGLFETAIREIKLAERNKRPLSVIMFDIDNFKQINDSFGHIEGDRILCDVVSVVLEEIRDTDLFGRVGGDELLVVLPETPPESALQIAERLRAGIAEKISTGRHSMRVTASFGVAWAANQNYDIDSLQASADIALYRAKNNGRNRVETIDANQPQTSQTEM